MTTEVGHMLNRILAEIRDTRVDYQLTNGRAPELVVYLRWRVYLDIVTDPDWSSIGAQAFEISPGTQVLDGCRFYTVSDQTHPDFRVVIV